LSKQIAEAAYFNFKSRGVDIHWQELTVVTSSSGKGPAMDVSKHYRARADLQKAFEDISV